MPTVVIWRGMKVKCLSSVKKRELEIFYTKNPRVPSDEDVRKIATNIRHPLDMVKKWLVNRATSGKVHSCCVGCPTYFTFVDIEVIDRECWKKDPSMNPWKRKLSSDSNNNNPQKKIKLTLPSCEEPTSLSQRKQKSTKIPLGLQLEDMQPVVVLQRLDLWCCQIGCKRCASRVF